MKLRFLPHLLLGFLWIYSGQGNRLIAQEDQDYFVLNLGKHNVLEISDLSGNCLVPVTLPTVNQTVHYGQTVFLISYGKDTKNRLLVLISPTPLQPQDIHFRVLKKRVDLDSQASVRVLFSDDQKSVKIEPGEMGKVEISPVEESEGTK